MATPTSPPPPYSASPRATGVEPNYPCEPPPYTPIDADKQPITSQPGTEHAQHSEYGTAGGKQFSDQYPPGTVPYTAHPMQPVSVQPLNTSTTLLINRERKPPTFFILSLITCLCFSPLFGLIAIIFSVMSDAAWSSGDPPSARRYSVVAISLSVVGILLTVFTIIIIFATGAIRISPL